MKPNPNCPDCQGTGSRDSGGVHPWGEAAMVPCDCSQPLVLHSICEDRCQYGIDVGMPEASCYGACQYQLHHGEKK